VSAHRGHRMGLPAQRRAVRGSRPAGPGLVAGLPGLRPADEAVVGLPALGALGWWGLAGLRVVAAGLGVPHTTVRGWWRRFRVHAPMLVAGLCALVVELGGLVAALDAAAERACLAALELVAARVRRRLGVAAPATWPLAALVSGGGWLGATTSPPWAGPGGRRWLPPEPRPPP
jgi:hypothetical protein